MEKKTVTRNEIISLLTRGTIRPPLLPKLRLRDPEKDLKKEFYSILLGTSSLIATAWLGFSLITAGQPFSKENISSPPPSQSITFSISSNPIVITSKLLEKVFPEKREFQFNMTPPITFKISPQTSPQEKEMFQPSESSEKISERISEEVRIILLSPYISSEEFFDRTNNEVNQKIIEAINFFKEEDPTQAKMLAGLYLTFIPSSLNPDMAKRFTLLSAMLDPELSSSAFEIFKKYLETWQIKTESKQSLPKEPISTPTIKKPAQSSIISQERESSSKEDHPQEKYKEIPKENPPPLTGENYVDLPIGRVTIAFSPVMIAQALQDMHNLISNQKTPPSDESYRVLSCKSLSPVPLDFCQIEEINRGERSFILAPEKELSSNLEIDPVSITRLIRLIISFLKNF